MRRTRERASAPLRAAAAAGRALATARRPAGWPGPEAQRQRPEAGCRVARPGGDEQQGQGVLQRADEGVRVL